MKKNKKSFKNSPNRCHKFIYKNMKVLKNLTLINKLVSIVIKNNAVKLQSIYIISNNHHNYSINKILKCLYNIKNEFLMNCDLCIFGFSYFELND